MPSTKLYHTHLLTTLSKCYFEINSYEDALEVLKRAEEIQQACFRDMGIDKVELQTVKMIAQCYSKMKQWEKAKAYLRNGMDYCGKIHGQKSIEMAKMHIQLAKISAEEKHYEAAITDLDSAIETLIALNYPNKHTLISLEQLLASYYEKNNNSEKQLETLSAKLELVEEVYDRDHKTTLKLKRNIASLLGKMGGKEKEAVVVLEEILESEEKMYGGSSLHVGKTLKMLGEVYSKEGETSSAEHYLKRAQKVLQEQGNQKLVK